MLESVEAIHVLPSLPPAGPGEAANGSASSSSRWYFVTAGDKGLLRTWDAASSKCVRRQLAPEALAETGGVGVLPTIMHLAPCGDGRLLAARRDGRVRSALKKY